MNKSERSISVFHIDPVHLTPYYNLALCDALAREGCQVTYVTSRYIYDQLPEYDTFKTRYLYFKELNHGWLLKSRKTRQILRGLLYPSGHFALLRQIHHQRPDIVHIQWSRLPRFDIALVRALRHLKLPVVHTIHNVRSSFATDADIRRLGNVYDLTDLIMLHTAANKQEFLDLYPFIPESKTCVIPIIHSPSVKPENPPSVREDFQLEEHHFVFLFFGIIRQYKGLDLLLEAFQQVHREHPQTRLLIAGKAESPRDLETTNSARQQDGVIVEEGFIPSEELWRYFAAADISVFPYRTVTQSAALIQAMDFGKPVIITRVGGLPESVDDNGWIVPPADINALVQAMINAVNTPKAQLKSKGKRSSEIVKNRHSGSTIARQLIDCYDKLLSQ